MSDSPSSTEERKREETVNSDDNNLEKTRSSQLITSRRATFQSSTSSSYESPSDGALNELVPQLTRRGTINPDSPFFSTEKLLLSVIARAKDQGIKRRTAGVVFRSLVVMGYGSEFTHQRTVGSLATGIFRIGETIRQKRHPPIKTILYSMDGVVKEGEMLLVLGKPGSGATTLLKTIAGETRGYASVSGDVHYNGIPAKIMHERFKGEVAYNGEVDVHFPHLTVEQTLNFSTALRTPHQRLDNMPRQTSIKGVVKVLGTVLGLRHTFNTKVGNDFVRGVSGGERKRVSIAETMSAGSVLGCWDNSTRGLDASSALEFVKALRLTTNLLHDAAVIAIYQAGEQIYEVFDKVTVLYEGRQIYFGPVENAKQYFIDQGWDCMDRQTTADFLTAVTDPSARFARPGYEDRVPSTPDDFSRLWMSSPERKLLLAEMEVHEQKYPKTKEALDGFTEISQMRKSKHMPIKSPYTVTIWMQINTCITRAYQRMWGDKSTLGAKLASNLIMSLVIGSVFYDTPNDTNGFFSKAGVMFFGILFNAFSAMGEISQMYEQRPIIEKHKAQALYRPAADALATFVADIPVKLLSTTIFDLVLYFMTGLSRTPGQFFTFYLFTFAVNLAMLAIFRTIAALTSTVEQALSIAGIMVLAIANYAGYSIPRSSMKPWFKWISYINPVSYAFESLMANEFGNENVPCAALIPPYPNVGIENQVCMVTGAEPGQSTVSGTRWLELSYGYSPDHLWRNLGIILAFFVFFTFTFLAAVEWSSPPESHGEVLVFQKGKEPDRLLDSNAATADEESGKTKRFASRDAAARAERRATIASVQEMKKELLIPKDVFTWKNVCCDVMIKGQPRRLLSNVFGYVKPGTLTALMGESGAGKTTLLDTLAQRNESGIITGDMLVNGKPLPAQFQRSCGYVQQQDVHMAESTVREALRFSALLRQPRTVSLKEKYDYVEKVIDLLEMRPFADAVIGVPGEGLNVLQRKKLTIGVEMAAKPALLVFCDEPTSGLDSQAAWGVVQFLRKLADAGQSILCTIHQPSAVLFEQFDRLLLLQKGGKTVYFGDTGEGSRTLIDYFERNGGEKCAPDANPAEYILEQIGAGATASANQNWHDIWLASPEKDVAEAEIEQFHTNLQHVHSAAHVQGDSSAFAMPFTTQFKAVTIRTFQHYYRSPVYISGKFVLSILASLFIGFTFYMQDNSVQGFQNKLFAVFMTTTIGTALINQIQPRFFFLRDLYEIRERPSKIYHWSAFLIAAILAEIPWNLTVGTCFFFGWYFPVGFWKDVTVPAARAAFQWLFLMLWQLFASTFAQFICAFTPNAPTAAMITSLMFSLTLIFAGVFQPLASLINFWHWMYWVSPLQYMISATVSNALHAVDVTCTPDELNIIQPPGGQTCQTYLGPFLESPVNLGQILNPNATSNCEYCRFSQGDAYLATLNMYWDQRWRDFGIFWAYIIFNVFAIFVLFYLTRIAKLEKKSTKSSSTTKIKDAANKVGDVLEKTLIRKHAGEQPQSGIDSTLNSADFAIFQGAGLETLNSRGLGREWTRRNEETD